MKIAKQYRPGITAAEAAGWILDLTKNGHLRLKPPKPVMWGDRMVAQIILPSSVSDHRGVKNFEADLRRSGVTIP